MNMDSIEILLVEDNPNDRDLALHALKKGKVLNTVHVVRDGEEALDFLYARGPHAARKGGALPSVVLLDLKLPKIDGLEVLRRIKKDSRVKKIPVVVLTSSKEDKDIDTAYKNGANSYIVKPVDFKQFTQALTTVGMYWIAVNQPPLTGRHEDTK